MASFLHTTQAALAPYPLAGTVFFDVADEDQDGGHCYVLQAGADRLVVDPRQKGEPGDIVVVWRKKRGPLVTRRLARRSPFRTYHFRDLDSGRIFELACNKVAAIHAIVGMDEGLTH